MSRPESWKTWEGRVVDGKFPLRLWLGGSDHSAVFLTGSPGQSSPKAVIKLIEADATEAARLLSRLGPATKFTHPHLMRIFDAGRCQFDGTQIVYIVMEYADEDLSQILPQRALTPAEVSDMLIPVLDALSYLHTRGFVHGHIKPSNVLAVQDLLKLSVDQITTTNDTGAVRKRMGMYDAPETAAGIVTIEADIWSLGVTIVAALTQNVPGSVQPQQGDPRVADTIPEPFRGIARECLHLDPKRRCTLAEIQARLQPGARSVPAIEEVSAPPRNTPNRRTIAGVAVALVAVVLAAWGILHSRDKSVSVPGAEIAQQPAPQPPPQSTSAAPAPEQAPATHPTKTNPAGGDVTHQVIPDIPRSARDTITGTIKVAVSVDVDPSGKVTEARLKSPGPSKYFAGQALKAAQGWEFAPPVADGHPTASAWLLQFRFKRGSTQVSPQRVTR